MTPQRDWKISALEVLQSGPVVPVIVLEELEHAVPLAKALVAGGIRVLEVTLRTPVALEAIRMISEEVPDAIVGAGTVATEQDLRNVADAGGAFAISPGLTPTLVQAAIDGPIALIPGVASASELMVGMEYGLTEFKFFPAVAAGGIGMLKSLGGPFPGVTFCPTGGIGAESYNAFLELDNVACVGGSWLAPKSLMKQGQWQKITDLAQGLVA